MCYLIVRHKIQDFSKWKPIYDRHGAVRKQSGCTHEQLFRDAENPQNLVMLFQWDTIENARKFSQSSDLRDKMREAGVIGTPEFHFLEEIEKKVTGGGVEKAA